MIRKTVVYTGSVQGVGFRWAACQVAGGHEVTGSVRNRPDGRVELIVEGETKDVEAMLAELASLMGGHIRDTKVDTSEPTGEYGDFGIAY